MTIRIEHPEFQPGRVKAIGVEFVDGFAEVESLDDIVRQALTQHGFKFTETKAAPKQRAPRGKKAEEAAKEPTTEDSAEDEAAEGEPDAADTGEAAEEQPAEEAAKE